MTRPTRNRPASMFAATAADLPLFSGTCQRAEAQQYTPREQAQQDSMFDRREYIAKKEELIAAYIRHNSDIKDVFPKNIYKELAALAPETNTEARQQADDCDDSHFDEVLDRAAKKEPGKDRTEYIDRSARSGYISNVEAAIITVRLGKKKAKK